MKTSIELPEELIVGVRKFNLDHANRKINVSGVCRIAIDKELKEALNE